MKGMIQRFIVALCVFLVCTIFTHTCVGWGGRWPGGRYRGGTRHLENQQSQHPDWPPAELPPGTIWLQW